MRRLSHQHAVLFFFQAEDGIRDLVRSRGLGDVYKRQRQKRNLLATLLLSQGVPMIVAGDEMGHTQQGNNLSLIHI